MKFGYTGVTRGALGLIVNNLYILTKVNSFDYENYCIIKINKSLLEQCSRQNNIAIDIMHLLKV